MSQAQLVNDSGALTTSNAQLVSISRPNEGVPAGQQQQGQEQSITEQQQGAPQPPLYDQAALLQALQGQNQLAEPPQAPPPQLDPAFVNQFEAVTGMKPEQFAQAAQQFQQMQQFVAQQQQQQQVQVLRQEWGDQFDSVMPEIAQRFAALPPQMQASLDNLDGARLLYAQLMQEKAAQGTQVPQSLPPQFDRARAPQQQSRRSQEPQFTKDQIRGMSEEEYVKNQSAIAYAYQNGLVR